MALTVRINDKPVLRLMDGIEKVLRPRSLNAITGEVMRGSIAETFEDEGFPARAWRLLQASTLAAQFTRSGARKTRTKRGRQTVGFTRFSRGKKILTDKGRLQRSITYRSRGKKLVIGTNLIYAGTHQFGAVITPKRAGGVLAIPIGGGATIFHKRVVIPARPFLLIKPDDPRDIADAIESAAVAAGEGRS